jgi:hypothetical protein
MYGGIFIRVLPEDVIRCEVSSEQLRNTLHMWLSHVGSLVDDMWKPHVKLTCTAGGCDDLIIRFTCDLCLYIARQPSQQLRCVLRNYSDLDSLLHMLNTQSTIL